MKDTIFITLLLFVLFISTTVVAGGNFDASDVMSGTIVSDGFSDEVDTYSEAIIDVYSYNSTEIYTKVEVTTAAEAAIDAYGYNSTEIYTKAEVTTAAEAAIDAYGYNSTEIYTQAEVTTAAETAIDAYGYNSTEIYAKTETYSQDEIDLVWDALMYHCEGPVLNYNSSTGATIAGYTMANGTAIIALDTMEIIDNGQRVYASATSELFDINATLGTIPAGKEVVFLVSYDSAWVLTLGATVDVTTETAIVPARGAGDSPVLEVSLETTDNDFISGTTNWDAIGVTATVRPLFYLSSGASALE